ncbi:5,6-dimethylbenzimidazole synthase [Pseudaestuariivita rosea]|uniref:5,6-dimethylbenzimidazole synthase n=1 Tax=Pseudaestuariivita rosea TaxID=2763263 RepID=UPI001ABA4B55
MPEFSDQFRDDLLDLMRWRRDVRRFRTDPVDEALLTRCLDAIRLAPSVGLSEPWRILRINGAASRAAVLDNFNATNAKALSGYDGDQAQLYSTLKLSGLRDAPVHLAVFCDDSTDKGHGLGAQTMPETRRYSVVGAVMQFWLMARAYGLGVGWVSILDPLQLSRDLDCPAGWTFIAYLCVGWPKTDDDTPELEQAGWEKRSGTLTIEVR